MERINPILDWFSIAASALMFAVALWYSPHRVPFRDEEKRRLFAEKRWFLLLVTAGLIGMKTPDTVGLEGSALGEWASAVGVVLALAGLLYGFRNWLRRRAV